MSRIDRRGLAALKAAGFIVGPREPRLNMAFRGAFMVCQPYEETDLPTEAARDGGPWCIVGDDLGELVDTACSCWEL